MTDARRLQPIELEEELVEGVARQIQLRGLAAPALMFLEASRPYRSLGSQAMCFFDPHLRGVFTGEVIGMEKLLADEGGIERLIERLEELDEESRWDA